MLYMEKYSLWFQSLLVIILSLKVLFLACVAWRIYAKRTNQLEQVQYMEILTDILHKSYSVLMSVLLMLLFSNIINVGEVCVDGHVKTYLATFGFLSFFDFLHM
jgi:uncharacterized membrane protein